jgi:hypothetical protein
MAFALPMSADDLAALATSAALLVGYHWFLRPKSKQGRSCC